MRIAGVQFAGPGVQFVGPGVRVKGHGVGFDPGVAPAVAIGVAPSIRVAPGVGPVVAIGVAPNLLKLQRPVALKHLMMQGMSFC